MVRRFSFIFICLPVMMSSQVLLAQDKIYDPNLSGCSGDYYDTNCWQNGQFPDPGSSSNDSVVFTSTAIPNVPYSINSDVSNTAYIDNAVLEFDLEGDWLHFYEHLHIGKYPDRSGGINIVSGEVWAGTTYLGLADRSDNNSLNVDGPDSSFVSRFSLVVGWAGNKNGLSITNGANVISQDTLLGGSLGADNFVVVDGVGSTLINNRSLSGKTIIGATSSNNALHITNGGHVESSEAEVGGISGADNNDVIIDGIGSTWTVDNYVYIGKEGGSNTVEVVNGGLFKTGDSFIGGNETGSNVNENVKHNQVMIKGQGSRWESSSAITVGYHGQNNSLLITEGGEVVSAYRVVVGQNEGNKNRLVVDGMGSKLTTDYSLVVGSIASIENSVLIANGGKVKSQFGYISTTSSSSENRITVTGAGSSLSISDSFFVGGGNNAAGGSGELNINDNGGVSVANTLKVWNSGAVNLSQGTIATHILDMQASGVFNMTGGRLELSSVLGDLAIEGGTLAARNPAHSIAISGDYKQKDSATLEIYLGGILEGEFGKLTIAGEANLDGELDVSFYDLGEGLFTANEGDTFDILTAETITGEFDVINLAALAEGLQWDINYLFDVEGSQDVLRLSVISQVPVPAAAWLFGSALLGLFSVRRKR